MFRFCSLMAGYLAGTFLTAKWVVRRVARTDVSSVGSGNPGMANVMTEFGFKAGIAVLIGDLLKTLLAMCLCALVLFPDQDRMTVFAWAGLGCIIGHNFPVWYRFRGGKGVACTCMVIFLMAPLPGLLSMIAGMLVVFATQYLALGGIAIPTAFTGWLLYAGFDEAAGVSAVLTLLMIIRNFGGIRRILRGTEKRVNVPGAIRRKLSRKSGA